MKIACYTSASFSYLDRARVLAESIRVHQPDWEMHLLLCDEVPPDFAWDPAREPFTSIVPSAELGVPGFRAWAFGHNIVEFCTAVKGFMLERLLDDTVEGVVYLDPDIALFSPMLEVEQLLQHSNVVLTPHVTTVQTTDESISDNEIGSLKHGVYNLGFVAVRTGEEGRNFARWWRHRLHHYCWDDIANGLFVDQRWCDLAPALFDGVAVLRNPGYNVASWNLGNRPVSIGSDGVIRTGGVPLRFFHFTKVNGIGENMLRRYAYSHVEVFELLRFYRQELTRLSAVGLPERWWAYAAYEDGTAVPQIDRIRWRGNAELRRQFGDPFASGTGSYQEWCKQH